jgi:hypothetical protein
MPHLRARNLTLLTAFIGLFAGGFACGTSADDPVAPGAAGSAGASAGGTSTAQAGTTSAQAGTTSTAGVTSGGGGAGTAGTSVTAGSGGSAAGSAGASGGGGTSGGGTSGGGTGGGGSGKVPTCLTMDVADGVNRGMNNYIECDVEEQALDFDVMAAYPANRKPGYDPSTTPATFTDFGTALTGAVAQECHPYCWKGNLTVGVDFVAGAEASLRGEVLFAFPPTVAPIVAPAGRNSLGWIFLDGPALPAGVKLTAQMVLKSADKGILVANNSLDVTLKKWFEFKYFPIQQGYDQANLVNITHIGFRITMSPPAAAANWSGVIYADHFQLRK